MGPVLSCLGRTDCRIIGVYILNCILFKGHLHCVVQNQCLRSHSNFGVVRDILISIESDVTGRQLTNFSFLHIS
jgi:hypothetical protein